MTPDPPGQGQAAILGVDHVQLAMPVGREDEARAFYTDLLGIPEVAKPPALAGRGGAWFETATVKIHLEVEEHFRPARKAHPALRVRDLPALARRLRDGGVDVRQDPLPDAVRVYVDDPFGNRIELVERRDKSPATLYFLCGKMAAGKSTLARELARRHAAILLVQDAWLTHLFPEEIVDVPAFSKFSARLRAALADHVCALLSRGTSVVLDFPGNTRTQRAWFRALFERANADHELHVIDAPDDVCKAQLRERSRHLPEGAGWTSDAEFDAITKFFRPPAADEGFNVVRHDATDRSRA